MLRGIDVAEYFLSKDPQRKLFNKELETKNGRTFYVGNARLNKYLHMAQNIYIAKTGGKLFADDLYAYDNGAVVPFVQENYSVLYGRRAEPKIPYDAKEYLDKIYTVFESATLDELIELSHEDDEWAAKSGHYQKAAQRMDSESRADEYKEQYADIIKVMDRMAV